MIFTISIVSLLSIYYFYSKSKSDIDAFKAEQIEGSKEKLKTIVEIGESILTDASAQGSKSAVEEALRQLSKIRFDDGEGYFWITTSELPYPTMVMHGIRGDSGVLLNDKKFNTIKEKPGKNLYQEIIEQSQKTGESYVDYQMYKPERKVHIPKMAHAKYIEELDWMLYAGIYMDRIETTFLAKEELLKNDLISISKQILLVAISILIVTLFLVNHYSGRMIQIVLDVKIALARLSKGQIVDSLVSSRKDELKEMVDSLNDLIGNLRNYAFLANEISSGRLNGGNDLFDESDEIAESLICMRDNLKSTLADMEAVIKGVGSEGNLKSHISLEGKEGVWREMAVSINYMVESIDFHFRALDEVILAMANGDISQRVANDSGGDVALITDNLNLALNSLNKLLGQIEQVVQTLESSASEMSHTGESLATTTSEIAATIGQMSDGASKQVSKVESVSNLMEEVMRSSSNMKEQAKSINDAAKRGVEESKVGLQSANKINEIVRTTLAYSHNTNESFQELAHRSNEITRILTVITEISSQTNLLALNAAIEAAQAGEAGRGFAVVADEIRKLAEDSKKFTTEIEELVGRVQKSIKAAAQELEVMNNSIKVGETESVKASQVFDSIVSSTSNTLTMSEDILKATEMQLDDFSRIVADTESIVVISEQTAAGTEEVSSSTAQFADGMEVYFKKSDELLKTAKNLKEFIDQFTLQRC